MLFAEFGTGQVFLSMLYFFLFFIWIWLLISVFGDIFRSRDLSGVTKALWCVGVIVFPYLGVFLYLVIRGKHMGQHAIEDAEYRQELFNRSVQSAVATAPSTADELEKLAKLRDQGVIDEGEFQRLKAGHVAV